MRGFWIVALVFIVFVLAVFLGLAFGNASRTWLQAAAPEVQAVTLPEQTGQAKGGRLQQPDAAAQSVAKSIFGDIANKASAVACSDTFNALGQALTSGSQYDIQSNWSTESPNSRPIRALVGMNYDNASLQGAAAGVVLASPIDGKCSGSMIKVTPVQLSCTKAVGLLPQGSVEINKLSGISVFSLAHGTQGDAILLPAGEETCVVVTTLQGGNIK